MDIYQKKSIALPFWGKWFFVLTVITLIYSATMEVAPYLHADELMIVDLGRTILNPQTDWSIAWLADTNQPVFILFYLGPVLQEVVYQIFGQFGPRIFALAGACVAATIMVGWLIAKNTRPKAAFILGLIFLLDPLFVQSSGLGRVDSWTMALCIGSCWMLQPRNNISTASGHYQWQLVIAGALLTIAFFIWPSAIFMVPLILLEVVYQTYIIQGEKNWHKLRKAMALFGLGALAMLIVMIIPVVSHFYAHIDNVIEGITTNTRSGAREQESPSRLNQVIELFRVFKFSPLVLIAALWACVWKRNIGLIVAGLAVCALMVSTVVYIQRVQYLLPYLIVAIAGAYPVGWSGNRKSSERVKYSALLGCLIWSISLSLVARTIFAFDQPAERKRELLVNAALSMIGPGNHTVFMPNEFYYAARSLGWKMYKPYLAQNDPLTSEIMQQILPNIDYLIGGPLRIPANIEELLIEEGFRYQGSFHIYNKEREMKSGGANVMRLRNLYSIFRQPYGPYRLYIRKLVKYPKAEKERYNIPANIY